MSERIPSLFGCRVFNEDTMAKYVTCEAVVAWKQNLKDGTSLTLETANAIADGMKAWALAGYLYVITAGVASFVLKIMGKDELSVAAGLSVAFVALFYWISYLYLRKKY